MFSNLLSSISINVVDFLDKLIFIQPDIVDDLEPIIGANVFSGINLICNSLIYGFLLYYAISYLLSHITFSQVEKPFQFVFKLFLCSFALNLSITLCSSLIYICSYISDMICSLGSQLLNSDISFAGFVNNILSKDYFLFNSFNLFSFDRYAKSYYII